MGKNILTHKIVAIVTNFWTHSALRYHATAHTKQAMYILLTKIGGYFKMNTKRFYQTETSEKQTTSQRKMFSFNEKKLNASFSFVASYSFSNIP